MPTPAGLVQQHLSPKTNTPGTDRRKFIQVHFPSPLSLCKCDGKQLHPWGLAFCWPCSMSMDGPFLSLLSDPLLSEMEPCVCETLSGCPFHRPSLPTPILTAPGRGLELFPHRVPRKHRYSNVLGQPTTVSPGGAKGRKCRLDIPRHLLGAVPFT